MQLLAVSSMRVSGSSNHIVLKKIVLSGEISQRALSDAAATVFGSGFSAAFQVSFPLFRKRTLVKSLYFC